MKCVYFFVICLLGHVKSDGPLLQIERGIDEFIQSNANSKPDYLQLAIDEYTNAPSTSGADQAVCNLCVVVTNALLKLRRNGASREDIIKVGVNLCLWFTTKKEPLCKGYINMGIDSAIYVVDNRPELTAEHICGIRLQEYGCPDPEPDVWSINIPDKSTDNAYRESNHSLEEYVVHITDFHYDPLYEPGSNTKCDLFICCQVTNGMSQHSKEGAGYWGDYPPCNTPLHSIQDLLKHIVKQHPKIDRVYYTGDTVNHQVWATSIEHNSNAIKKVFGELKNVFKSIPVYPVLGNHDAHPTDSYAPTNITDSRLSTQWLYDLVAEEWSKWLPSEDTKATIRKGGYYSVLVKPGFRIIGLNNNLCYTFNLWLLDNSRNVQEHLQWLVDILAEAEKNGESVHIVSHVQPGDKGCLRKWNYEYRRIVDRFAKTIAGQFNGHTHTDELRIFYGLQNPNEVVNVAFTGGSFTTFVGLNPSYKIYNIGSSTWRVNDYDQWMYNLQEANETPDKEPKWFKQYSFKDAYGLSELVPSAYHQLLQKMASNTSLIEQYRRFRVRDSPVLLKASCGKECLYDMLCSISHVENEDSLQCTTSKGKVNKI